MQIEIAQRYRPYSSEPGTKALIPGTSYTAKIFPGKIELYYEEELWKEIEVPVEGPLSHFTVTCDLEKWKLSIFGKEKSGFFRYHLYGKNKSLFLLFEKGRDALFSVEKNVPHTLREQIDTFPKSTLRLALGVSKKLHWKQVVGRRSLEEILPVWLQAGLSYPVTKDLLFHTKQETHQKDLIKEALLSYFLAGFSGIFVPRAYDFDYQNIFPNNCLPCEDAFSVLSNGASFILSLFLEEEKGSLFIRSPLFHSGRLTGYQTSFGSIDIRWSGYRPKVIIIHAKENEEISLSLPKEVASFRVRKNRNEKGIRVPNGNPIAIEKNLCYCVDRLEY